MGSGLWGTIQRIARPILAKFVPRLGKTVANKAIGVLAGAASDALNHRNSFVDSMTSRGRMQAQETMEDLMRQSGGRQPAKRRKASSPKKRPPAKRPKPKKKAKARNQARCAW